METVSAQEIGGNITNILTKVITSQNPLIITADGSQPVAMIHLTEIQSIQDTLYLLSNPANASHLQKSISDLDNNQGIAVELEDL